MAVIDIANLQQATRQYAEMVEQVSQLKAQLDQLRSQYQAVTGSYGAGSLLRSRSLQAEALVPGSWEEVVRLQQNGAYGTKMDRYEGLMKAVDPALLAKDESRAADAYKLSYDDTRAAFAVADASYDAIEMHRMNIEDLMGQIDATRNIKEATDLNSRLVSENALLQIEIARLSVVRSNLSASAQNDRIQSEATRTEMLRFDPNYRYEVNRQ
ncbi:MAG: type IV secretion system protein [Burkholderiales bacterium]